MTPIRDGVINRSLHVAIMLCKWVELMKSIVSMNLIEKSNDRSCVRQCPGSGDMERRLF